jgi:flagellar motor switch protein FliM
MVAVNDLVNLAKDDILRLDSKIEDRVRLRAGGASDFDALLMEMDGRKGVKVISRVAR